MRAYWVGFFVACVACDAPPAEAPPEPSTLAQKIEAPATREWTSTFADVPLKLARVLPVGQTLDLDPSTVVGKTLLQRNDGQAYLYDVMVGGDGTRIDVPSDATFVARGPRYTAVRSASTVTVLEGTTVKATESLAMPALMRGAQPQASMIWDRERLLVLTDTGVMRWTQDGWTKLVESKVPVSRVDAKDGAIVVQRGDTWLVAWADGHQEFTGSFSDVWMDPQHTRIFRKSSVGIEVANAPDGTFELIADLEEVDRVFGVANGFLAQWWPAEPSWQSPYAQAALWSANGVSPRFDWGASDAQSIDDEVVGLGVTPPAVWRHRETSTVRLDAAASGALFFDGKTIARRFGQTLQRIPAEQPSSVFPLRTVRQIVCAGDVCLVVGREGAIDRVDLKSMQRQTFVFVHPHESLPPVMAFDERATILCEPRCATVDGRFVQGIVSFDTLTGEFTDVTQRPSRKKRDVVDAMAFKHPLGLTVTLSELTREPHKIGRPPRLFQVDFDAAKSGISKPIEWVASAPDHIFYATATKLGRVDGFATDVANAHNLVVVGDTLHHLVGRGLTTVWVTRDVNTGEVMSETPMPNLSAFAPAAEAFLVAMDDGRLALGKP
ncbi:MAG: hypothetical protein R3E66_12675 [bacterium]